jgi:hypothetical protein
MHEDSLTQTEQDNAHLQPVLQATMETPQYQLVSRTHATAAASQGAKPSQSSAESAEDPTSSHDEI